MLFILDENIDISMTLEEISSCPKKYWDYCKPWSASTSGGLRATRDIDKLLIVWHPEINGVPFWEQIGDSTDYPDWRKVTPVVTPEGQHFKKTLKFWDEYWAQRGMKIGRAFFNRFEPGDQVYPHIDRPWGASENHSSRVGISLTVNADSSLTAEGLKYNPAVGTLYWFKNDTPHSAVNNGNTVRLVMYMDLIPDDQSGPTDWSKYAKYDLVKSREIAGVD